MGFARRVSSSNFGAGKGGSLEHRLALHRGRSGSLGSLGSPPCNEGWDYALAGSWKLQGFHEPSPPFKREATHHIMQLAPDSLDSSLSRVQCSDPSLASRIEKHRNSIRGDFLFPNGTGGWHGDKVLTTLVVLIAPALLYRVHTGHNRFKDHQRYQTPSHCAQTGSR